MGNALLSKTDSSVLERLQAAREFSAFSEALEEYLSSAKTLSLRLDFAETDVFSLYLRQFEFFVYFSVSACEAATGRAAQSSMAKADARKVDFLLGALQQVLNLLGRVSPERAETLLWKTRGEGVP